MRLLGCISGAKPVRACVKPYSCGHIKVWCRIRLVRLGRHGCRGLRGALWCRAWGWWGALWCRAWGWLFHCLRWCRYRWWRRYLRGSGLFRGGIGRRLRTREAFRIYGLENIVPVALDSKQSILRINKARFGTRYA